MVFACLHRVYGRMIEALLPNVLPWVAKTLEYDTLVISITSINFRVFLLLYVISRQ